MRTTLASLALAGLAAACTDDAPVAGGFTDRQVVVDFADQVVIPTYQLLDARARALDAAVRALAATPSPATLTSARDAWIAARVPWEQSEAFLFGPVSARGYDPAMDAWPVERTDLDAVLASDQPLTATFVHNLPETQKGFHTIEYLLFGEGGQRTAAELDGRTLAYLTAVTAELTSVTGALTTAWTAGSPSYRDVLATAGDAGNTAYPSLDAAVQELLGGMSGICDEVANGKIATPYDAHDADLIESQFSDNALVDFADNLRSVANAYAGDVPAAGTTGHGLDEVVRARDAALDARFRGELDAAIAAIGAIPGRFGTAIVTPPAYPAIEAAQAAIRTVQTTIDRDLAAVVR